MAHQGQRKTWKGSHLRHSSASGDNLRQLVSHLPDVVIHTEHHRPMPYDTQFEAVLLFVDVSGFTDLCERYTSLSSKSGVDQLTRTLNAYMGTLVDEILTAGGDVLKFAGDAILAAWKCTRPDEIRKKVIQVVKCCINIQRTCGEYQTDVGVTLRVKMGVAAGNTTINFIGNKEYCHYVSTGPVVEEVNKAESFCCRGDVVLSPSAWQYCNKRVIDHEILSDGKHVKVLHVMDFDASNPYASAGSDAAGTKRQLDPLRPPGSPQTGGKNVRVQIDVMKMMAKRLGVNLDQVLRLYVPKPVLRKLDDNLPTEYMSEMRLVSIVFVNLMLSEDQTTSTHSLLQDALDIIYPEVRSFQGSLNKIFMFDKGCTFLVLFGLPGFKHEGDCAHALQCSYRLKNKLDMHKNITQTSIGVTTGNSFCGVVGHKDRHEYTVIGRKVNMAARLMMYYPAIVSCDNETFTHSKLNRCNFKTMQAKKLKGMHKIGIVREYTEEGKENMASDVQTFEYPLLGREKEMEILEAELKAMKANGENHKMLVIRGDSGMGKTRVLDAVINRALNMNIKVFSCTLNLNDTQTPLFLVRNYLYLMFNILPSMNHHEKERKLSEKCAGVPEILDNLYLLNTLLGLKFPATISYVTLEERQKALHELLHRLVHQISLETGVVLFAADDAHFIDADSWEFLSDLGIDNNALVVLAMCPLTEGKGCKLALDALKDPNTISVDMKGIDPKCMSALACQILNVARIPKEIEAVLHSQSHGNPTWCEQLLREMFCSKRLLIVEDDGSKHSVTVAPNPALLVKKQQLRGKDLVDKKDWLMTEEMTELAEAGELNHESGTSLTRICILAPGAKINEVRTPDSMKGMIITRIDRMQPTDQMVLKCASLIGTVVSRQMLLGVVPGATEASITSSLKRLFASGVLECASFDKSSEQKNIVAEARCDCIQIGTSSKTEVDPAQCCRLMKFKSVLMQETAYELFLDSQRKNLHEKAAMFLESMSYDCAACQESEQNVDQVNVTYFVNLDKNKSLKTPTPSKTPVLHIITEEEEPQPSVASFKPIPSFHMRTRRHSEVAALQTMVHYVGAREHQNVIERMKAKLAGSEDRLQSLMDLTDPQKQKADDLMNHWNNLDGFLRNKATSSKDTSMFQKASSCECDSVLTTVYPQLVRHWKETGNVHKTLHYLTEAGAAFLSRSEPIQALSYLKEARKMLESVDQHFHPLTGVELFEEAEIEALETKNDKRARIESLLGEASFATGDLEEAVYHFTQALHYLGVLQFHNKVFVGLRIFFEGIEQYFHLNDPTSYIGYGNPEDCKTQLEIAHCLFQLFHHYIEKGDVTRALAVALKQVNVVETVGEQEGLHQLVVAYTCMMDCCRLKKWRGLAKKYEAMALKRCANILCSDFTPDNLVVVANVFCTCLESRLANGDIQGAVESDSASFATGDLEEAVYHFTQALHYLGVLQFHNKVFVGLRIFFEGIEQYFHLNDPTSYIGYGNPEDCKTQLEIAHCLFQLFHHYIEKGDVTRALAVALKQVNVVETVGEQEGLHQLVVAYTCMMDCCRLKKWRGLAKKYEAMALKRCANILCSDFTPDNLVVVANVFCTCLESRLANGDIQGAVESGGSAKVIAEMLRSQDMEVEIWPSQASALLYLDRISECETVLEQLESVAIMSNNPLGSAYFIAGCLDVGLDAGLRELTIGKNQIPGLRKLWNVSLKFRKLSPASGLSMLVKMCECRLLCANKAGKRPFADALLKKAQKSLKSLQKQVGMLQVLQPRMLHMEAYLSALKGNLQRAKKLLTQCETVSSAMGNILETEWAAWSQKVWFDPAYADHENAFWMQGGVTRVQSIDSTGTAASVRFSLPLSSVTPNTA
ncbi:LOW QUALITY PROTEIN: adenylate cyclase type 10 [Lingula anatina]|uniref:LOW QUALITY PROTEIN: adenylate cyclase type 10 n=1 Tax=Lingula anatina TaxID=7574 RepID=A0A2R2MNI3_LINAN|nr:LOW QUALITY PROTEIN: adenylate cyclase type 10 [Lingula anatina]|eukprot:XP_023931775.1 LOW QUALITY PROTEIN: adenylate cyclase type 10 [Lingula anatina]